MGLVTYFSSQYYIRLIVRSLCNYASYIMLFDS
jgi:hypothetical protein